LAHGAAFWILMGRSILIRDRDFEFSGVFLGQVDVLSGGLKVEKYISKYVIRSRLLLGGVYFGIFIGVPLIYGTFVL
jgi:hypothetical protein